MQLTTNQVPAPLFLTGQIMFTEDTFCKADITPKIIKQQECYKAQRVLSIKNYVHYVAAYNKAIPQKNKEILKYNANVYTFIEQHKLHAESHSLIAAFENEIGKVSIDEYNLAAKLKNNAMGKPIIVLKKHIKVRPPIKDIFSILMYIYGMQIHEKNKILKNCGATTTRAIQKLQVNHCELSRFRAKDSEELDYCKRTIHNHINRLVDAGVLFGYEFRGHQKPVNYYVNNEILVLFDQETRKIITTENEPFNPLIRKGLHNNSTDTRTLLNKKEINENVDNHSPLKGIISQLPIGNDKNNYKNTQMRKQSDLDGQKIQAGAEKNCRISDYLYDKIEDTQCLMEDLTKGNHINYKLHEKSKENISISLIEREILEGNLSKEEYLLLVQQQLIKSASPIFKNLHNSDCSPYLASYRAAFNEIYELLINPNRSIPSKNVAFYRFQGVLWCINRAKQMFNGKKYSFQLTPGEYFDPTRKTKNSKGFGYVIEIYKDHKNYETYRLNKKLRQIKASENHDYKVVDRIRKKANEVKNGKISVHEYIDYVNNNATIPKPIKDNAEKYLSQAFQC